jgi:aryl-alcohol dehydrogenase-like predicted oxidoreductase
MVISTKAGFDMWPGPYGEWGSRLGGIPTDSRVGKGGRTHGELEEIEKCLK